MLPDGLTTINQYAFSNSGIRLIEFPNSLLTIGNSAFQNCTKMNYLVLPDMIKSLSDYAFYNCIGLRSITMGSALTTIGKYTFYGCDGLVRLYLGDNVEKLLDYSFADCINLQSVVLPEKLKTIGNAAFYNCPKITSLTISNTVSSIADNAFNGIKNLTFYCNLNSYAATYAIDHNIPIIDTEEISADNSKYIDYQNSYYKVNGDGVSASGYLAMVAKYTFNDDVTVSNITLTFNVPAAVELEESTLTVDGTLCTNYTFNNGILSVPVSKNSGVVRFLLKPLNYDLVTAYSKISFYDGSSYQTEILGTIYTEIPILSIIAPNKTSSDFVEVSGVTMPNCKVTIYVNGSKYTTVTSNKVGDYSATIKFSSLSDGKKYKIQAEVIDDLGTVITSETSTIYKASVPELTEFIMEYGGKKYDLLKLKGTKPNITWASSYKYKFTVRFNNAESVSSVNITSTRNNVKKSIQAVWNDTTNAFIAEGYFDNNSSYVPGIISLQYTNKTGNASFADGFDFNSEEAYNDLPEEWKNSEFVINENTEDKTDIIVDFPEDPNYDDDGKDYAMHYTVEKLALPSNYTVEDAISDGYAKITDGSGVSKYIRQTIGSDNVSVDIIDVPDKAGDVLTVTSLVMDVYEAADDVPGVTLPSGKNFTPVKDGINIAGFVLSSYETINDIWKIDQIQQRIKNSNMSQAEKDEAMSLTHQVQFVNFASFLMRGALFVAGGLSFAGAGLWALLPVTALLFTGLLVDYFDDAFMETLLNMSFTWAIDPSGFVYDAETGKPILGATVTAYWIPFDEENSDYWNAKPSVEEYGIKWESTAFSQENPLTTDLNGWYAWDVPEGWWRVKCERYGYETIWSEWLPVPPPQTSVNISMIPLDNCGYCGENVIWAIDDNGILTISGEGEMYDYSSNNFAPWSDITSSIQEVVVENGVTSIGQNAFYNCENLSIIKISSSVSEIANNSFHEEVVVYCYTDSFAHSWCVENSHAFVLLDESHKHSYTKATTEATCLTSGYTTYTCECGDSYISDEVGALGHNMKAYEMILEPSCVEEGLEQSKCSRCDYTEIRSINPTENHLDNNGDGYCDLCDVNLDSSVNCDCMCHKTGIMNIIWKILKFFYKLFKINPICECGAAHY